jgi:hypothetical protein
MVPKIKGTVSKHCLVDFHTLISIIHVADITLSVIHYSRRKF